MLELYDIPGRGLALYDPKDPCLPKGAVKVEKKEAPKPKAKAAKPANKAIKAENK